MTSAIDPTKPADGVAAVKSDLRTNLQAASDEIEHGGFGKVIADSENETAFTSAPFVQTEKVLSSAVISARSFGILPGNSIDHSTTLQDAIDEINAETPNTSLGSGGHPILQLDAGTYRVNELNLRSLLLVGKGRDTLLRYNGAGGLGTKLIDHSIGGGAARFSAVLKAIRLHGQSDDPAVMCETLYFSDSASDIREFPNFDACWFTGAGLFAIDVLGGAPNMWLNGCSLDRVGRSLVRIRAAPLRRGIPVKIGGLSTIVWNDATEQGGLGVDHPENRTNLDHWVPFIGSGSVGGKLAYWGAAGVELLQGGSTNGGGYFVHFSDCRFEWSLEGDPAGNGAVLDANTSNADRVHEHLFHNVTGFTNSTANQLVGFKGTNTRQPIVRALNSHLQGAARQIHDYTQDVSFGNGQVSQFDWMGGTYFAENGGPMIGSATSRPATALTINKAKGKSFLASDTGQLSVSDGSQWIDVV